MHSALTPAIFDKGIMSKIAIMANQLKASEAPSLGNIIQDPNYAWLVEVS